MHHRSGTIAGMIIKVNSSGTYLSMSLSFVNLVPTRSELPTPTNEMTSDCATDNEKLHPHDVKMNDS